MEDPEEGIYQRMRKVSVKAEDRGEDTQGASGSEAGVISDGRVSEITRPSEVTPHSENSVGWCGSLAERLWWLCRAVVVVKTLRSFYTGLYLQSAGQAGGCRVVAR